MVGDRQVRNDHTDAAYDKSVLEGFDPIHRDISDLIGTIATSAPRIGSYKQRLDLALGKIRSGDLRYIAAPDRDSYHTVWFELHQDLIGLAGTTRQKEAAAGRACKSRRPYPSDAAVRPRHCSDVSTARSAVRVARVGGFGCTVTKMQKGDLRPANFDL